MLNREIRSDTAHERMSIRYLTRVGLILLVAFGTGLTIKAFRFRSWEKDLVHMAERLTSNGTE